MYRAACRTSENENISQAAQAEAITYVYWDIKRFLSYRCLCIIYRHLSFLLIVHVEVNEHLVHLAVVRQLANNRQGTQKAKTRSEAVSYTHLDVYKRQVCYCEAPDRYICDMYYGRNIKIYTLSFICY